MQRRDFLALTVAAAVVTPLAVRAEALEYTPGLVDQLLADGKTVFVDFKAEWCSTCARQERVINELKAENPDYEKAVTFVNVDWDAFKNDALTQGLEIPRRSTLVALKGKEELGRIVAGTAKADIQALMDKALMAATST